MRPRPVAGPTKSDPALMKLSIARSSETLVYQDKWIASCNSHRIIIAWPDAHRRAG
jgi:hypothetical protein